MRKHRLSLRFPLAVLAGTAISFAVGGLSWEVLPFHRSTLAPLTNAEAVAKVLVQEAPAAGMYLVPNAYDGSIPAQAWRERVERGPVALIAFRPAGTDIGMTFVKELLRDLLAALVLGMILVRVGVRSAPFAANIAAAFGMFSALSSQGLYWAHYGFSSEWVAWILVDLVFGWYLAGLSMGAILKAPRTEPVLAGSPATA